MDYCPQREFPRSEKLQAITEDFVQFFLSLSCCPLAGSPHQKRPLSTEPMDTLVGCDPAVPPGPASSLQHLLTTETSAWRGTRVPGSLGQNLAQDQHHSAEGYGGILLRRFLLSTDTLAGTSAWPGTRRGSAMILNANTV